MILINSHTNRDADTITTKLSSETKKVPTIYYNSQDANMPMDCRVTLVSEGSDIYRDITFGVNIEGFEAYRCIGVTLWG